MLNSKPSKSTISICLSCGAFFRISIRSRTSISASHLERTLNRIAIGVRLILQGELLHATSALGGDLGTEHLIDDVGAAAPAVPHVSHQYPDLHRTLHGPCFYRASCCSRRTGSFLVRTLAFEQNLMATGQRH